MTTGVAAAPAPLLRPAAQRFHSRFDWLESWHSFSFADHYDPAWMGFGPLRVINDDTIAAGRGFGMHPHRDMEIITVMVEGQLSHRDSMGQVAVIEAGEVQVMGAGTGVLHSEMNQGDRPCRLLQIWIEPSQAGLPPVYGQKPFQLGADWTPLLDPAGASGALSVRRPIRLWRARPGAGDVLDLPLTPGGLGWLQLIDGTGAVQAAAEPPRASGEHQRSWPLQRGDGLGFGADRLRAFSAGPGGADLLLFELG